ncbi:MAG: hypothetical protein Q4D76_05495 [Oscillospiraceae bacterium]|nr:hypothetical protein [Oscillospiraceae bacterium]
MANGIYMNINSAQDLEDMQKNREQMHKIKVWFELAALIEIISALYLSFTSVLGIFAIALGLIYVFLLNRKNRKICLTAFMVHIILAVIVLIPAVMFCADAFALKAGSAGDTTLLTSGSMRMFTSLSPEYAESGGTGSSVMNLLSGGVKLTSVINLICSLVMTITPIVFNYKAVCYCSINEELSVRPGYPEFHPDLALEQAAADIENKSRNRSNSNIETVEQNKELLNKLREQNVDFTDMDSVMSGIIASSKETDKKRGYGTARKNVTHGRSYDELFSGLKKNNYSTSELRSLSDVINRFTSKKETEAQKAMKELVAEAERLKALKANPAETGRQEEMYKTQINPSLNPTLADKDTTGEYDS